MFFLAKSNLQIQQAFSHSNPELQSEQRRSQVDNSLTPTQAFHGIFESIEISDLW